MLFGITESDIGALDEEEFGEVWAALGKVARARARAREVQRSVETKDDLDQSEDDEGL
jgi:hypothetical protein